MVVMDGYQFAKLYIQIAIPLSFVMTVFVLQRYHMMRPREPEILSDHQIEAIDFCPTSKLLNSRIA